MSAGGITARATIMVPVFSGQHYLSASADIDGEYRYSLERRWEYGGPTALFVGLNPSTATAENHEAYSPWPPKCRRFVRPMLGTPTARRHPGMLQVWLQGRLLRRI